MCIQKIKGFPNNLLCSAFIKPANVSNHFGLSCIIYIVFIDILFFLYYLHSCFIYKCFLYLMLSTKTLIDLSICFNSLNFSFKMKVNTKLVLT